MRVLFLGSNPTDEATLNLEREITELQRKFAEAVGEAVNFRFLPSLPLEDLPAELIKYRPQVLHISTHGSESSLSLARADGNSVEVGADALAAFLEAEQKPHLIYINACNSKDLAKRLTELGVGLAIGSTAAITNRAARAAAVVFYNRILSGYSVKKSFEASKAMVDAVDRQNVQIEIYQSVNTDAGSTYLYRNPKLISDFARGFPKKRDNSYEVRFGLVGCPSNTVQIVFFTDDGTFIQSDDDLEENLCEVVRSIPARGTVWMDEDGTWQVEGDFRLFAVGSLGDGSTFSVGTTLCNAIETRYRLSPEGKIPQDIAEAVKDLRTQSGADLEHHPERQRILGSGTKRVANTKQNEENGNSTEPIKISASKTSG